MIKLIYHTFKTGSFYNKPLCFPRDERPPKPTVPGSQQAQATRRWVPPSVLRRDVQPHSDRHDQIFRRVRGY